MLAWPSSEGTRLQTAHHRGCESLRQLHAEVAQPVERRVETPRVGRANRSLGTMPVELGPDEQLGHIETVAGSTPASGTPRFPAALSSNGRTAGCYPENGGSSPPWAAI